MLPVISQSVESKGLKKRTGLFLAHEITLGDWVPSRAWFSLAPPLCW